MTGRNLMAALAGALLVVALMAAWQLGRGDAAASVETNALSSLDGREVFDADGATLGVVEQTLAARQGDRTTRYAMVRVSRVGDAGLRLAVPAYRLQAVEDGLMLTVDRDDESGEFVPTAAQLRGRT